MQRSFSSGIMKKLLAYICLFLAGALTFHSCVKPEFEAEVKLSLSASSLSAEWDDTSVSVNVSCNNSWTAKLESVSWASIKSGSSGSGDGSITVALTPNDGNETRKATLTVKSSTVSRELVITQYYNDVISLSDSELSFGCNGGRMDFDVTAKGDFEYILDGNPDWARVIPFTKVQTKAFILELDPNLTSSPRSTSIVVTDKESGSSRNIAVNQEARDLDALDYSEIGVYGLGAEGAEFATERIGRQVLYSEDESSYSVCFMTPINQSFFEISGIQENISEGQVCELEVHQNLSVSPEAADKRFYLARCRDNKYWFSFEGYCVIINR